MSILVQGLPHSVGICLTDAVAHLLQAGELHANAKHHPDVTDDQVAQNLSVDCFVCPTVQDQMSSVVILGTLSAIKVNQILF